MEDSTIETSISLYFHIPFCSAKCGYCSFYSVSCSPWKENRSLVERTIQGTLEQFYREYETAGYPRVETVYIGGGTPSILPPKLLKQFIDSISAELCGTPEEWTVEANPESLTGDVLSVLTETPVDRLSLGIQSASEQHLKFLGRGAGVPEIVRAVSLLGNSWDRRINVDFIYGIPDQNAYDIIHDLRIADDLEAGHISLYGLTYEPGTPLAASRTASPTGPAAQSESEEIQMMSLWKEFDSRLKTRGYSRYEISNFCRPGMQSRHNLRYWRYQPYLGCGPGAHSTLIDNGAVTRIENTADIKRFIAGTLAYTRNSVAESYLLGLHEAMLEFCLMGLRLTEGIDHFRFQTFFDREFTQSFQLLLDSWAERGLAETYGTHTRLTNSGMWIMDTLLLELAERIDDIPRA